MMLEDNNLKDNNKIIPLVETGQRGELMNEVVVEHRIGMAQEVAMVMDKIIVLN